MVLLVCLAVLSASTIQSPRAAAVKGSSFAQTTHPPILIVGNSGFTPANGVTGGTGTASDPYFLQGWNINVCWHCPYYGIEVANTTADFRIFNVTVSSLTTAQPATGILLKNVTNGRIDNSVVQDGSIFCCGGIIVDSSRNVVVSTNNADAGSCNNFSSCSTYDTVGAYGSTNVTISGNSIRADASGNVLGVKGSSNVNIINNTILMGGLAPIGAPWRPSNGIVVSSSGNVKISQNSLRDAACSAYSPAKSIIVGGSSSVQIFGNNVTNIASSNPCGSGIVLQSATGTLVYHNNLVNNSVQASDDNPGKNQWDNGYPRGGNYWSDYKGVDNCDGPQQDICGHPDGIGDTPYVFGYSKDRYPLMNAYRQTLISVIRGSNNGIYWSKYTGSWRSWQPMGGSTASAPVLCSSGSGAVDLIVRGSDNSSIWHKSYSNGIWSAWDTPGGLTNDQPACAYLNGALYVAVRGGDNSLWWNSRNDTSSVWSGWQSLGGILTGPPVLAASPSTNRLDLVVQGGDYSIWHIAFENGYWSRVWDSPGGQTPSTPSAVSDGSTLRLAVRGMGNDLWYASLSFTSHSWSGWMYLAGSTSSAPAVATDSFDVIHLVVRGMDNGVYHRSLANAEWSSFWDVLGGTTPDRPVLVQFGTGVAVQVRGADSTPYSCILGPSTWSVWTGLGENTGSPPALSSL